MNKTQTCATPPNRVEVAARGASYRSAELGIGVRVDAAETRSGLPELLRARGVSVVVERLPAGDYALGDTILVERKTASDFLHSLRSGRLFAQARKLANGSGRPMIVVEGDPYELVPEEDWAPLRGAMLSLLTGFRIPVLQTGSTHETAGCLVHALQQEAKRARKRLRWRQARRAEAEARCAELEARPALPPAPKPQVPPDVLALLEALPEVGETRALALATSLGSLADVAQADLRRLLEVPGIGPQTAIGIYQTLRAAAESPERGTNTPRPDAHNDERSST